MPHDASAEGKDNWLLCFASRMKDTAKRSKSSKHHQLHFTSAIFSIFGDDTILLNSLMLLFMYKE